MNLALPALVILLGILPGIACFYGYFAGRFTKRSAGVSPVEELALYVIFAIPIDAAALVACRSLGIYFDFTVATRLFGGSFSDASVAEIASVLRSSAMLMSVSYLAMVLCGYAIGACARRIVWTCRMDIYVPLLRLKHAWYYVLQGRLANLPRGVLAYVDVLTEHPGDAPEHSRLYRGLVIDFEISPSGGLDSLTLRDAQRGCGRGAEFTWKDIPSSRLMIVGSKIHSINVTYVALEEQRTEAGVALWWYEMQLVFRRFVFEEP